MKEYRNYLFDADGTLLDTTDLVVGSFVHACRELYGTFVEPKQIYPLLGLPLRQSFQKLLDARENIDCDSLIDTYKSYQLGVYREHLKIFPHVESTLQKLRQRGKRIAVVTSRKRESVMLYLRHTGIDTFFDIVVTPEDTHEHKPHPAPAQKALARMGGSPADSLFIGDSMYDIECGHRCGMDTAFVLWSRSTYSTTALSPTYEIGDMSELISFPP